MNRFQDRNHIVETICHAAAQYKFSLMGKSFLYVFDNRYIEVVFRKKDFLHLTGVDTDLSADQFFKNAINNTLRANQIDFSQRHPFDLCIQKTDKLSAIPILTNSGIFILEDMVTSTYTYEFCLSELNFTICLTKDTDDAGNIKSRYYVPRSLRVENSVRRAENAFMVSFIFSKPSNDRFYSSMNFSDNRDRITSLPLEILCMLSNEFLSI